ncbi:MAG: ribonuclease HII [Myxococcaceae bacterium]|nr:ribonuclease HII [Myxococcaceae bacterium]
MKRRSLAALRERLAEGKGLPRGVLFELANDDRAGAQALVKAVKAKASANRAEGQRLKHMLRYENELYAQGVTLIAGVDEAGMAPLAGPVTAAACILPKGYRLKGLDDSKKILDEGKREELATRVKADAVCWAVGWASVEEIDALNIYHAGLLAMRRAVEGLGVKPEFCLVDARKIPHIECPQKGIIHGDALSLSIAGASVIAKTTRDQLMNELDVKHPGYGFASHKGYPTPEHQDALERLGALLIHRRSFAPVRRALGLEPTQEELFALPAVKGKARGRSRA